MPLPPALELGLMPQTHEQSLHRGVICKYITDSPEDYETDRLAEPFGSPYDPAVTRATRGPITDGHPVPPAPKLEPIQRPISNSAIPESNMRDFRKDYLAQQFAAHRPAVEQAGLIGAPPGLPPIVPENQHAYNYRDQPSSHLPASSHLYPPTSACDAYRPHDTTPSSYGQGNPPLPTVEQLLEGVPVPTWEQLDTLSRQIKELYALRALLDPHGHRLRTHVPVLPNIPSKEHRIWGGPVPLVRESSRVEGVVDNDWNSLGDASQDHPPTRPYETQALVLPEISPLCLDEFRIPTPVTVVGEPLFEDPLGDQALEPDDSDDASTQCQLDPNEVSITEVSQAWDKLNDVMVQVRISCDTFVYPSKLDFIPAHGSDDEPLVNQRSLRNKAFINHWEFLYRSLDKLNQMEPLSDRMFFGIRRAVNEVDYELEKLEEFATKLWKKECQEKERRRFWRNVFSSELYWTSFPVPAPSPDQLNRPEQPAPALRAKSRAAGATPVSPEESHLYYYFCIDDRLLYLSFFEDWGPLNLAQVYRACILIHELLQDANLKRHRIVLYSSSDPRRRANSALLMALYCMIVQRRTPWEVFYPIAEVEFMPFRDAGRGRSDFHLGIQDCLWGVWKAQHNHLLDMNEFSVDEYEYYEKVDNGDWNWITPGFIAFASPVDSVWIRQQKEGKNKPGGATTSALQRKLPTPFMNVLEYFSERNVKLVVRLNNELYDKAVFEERGIEHLDLYFDDGTNPADDITRTFIAKSDAIIEAGGAVAVHCKAGLGRTGTLIGAYLIYKYGFTASEAIGFMRIVRPGSVVGPQQQFMYMKQLEWAKWAAIDEIRRAEAQRVEVLTPRTPPEEIQPMTTGSTNGTSASLVRSGQSVAPSSPRTTTPPGLLSSPVITAGTVPVTPHKTRPTTPIKTDAPVLQPRKTPAAKRAAAGDEEVEDEGDQLGVLGVGFRRVSGKRSAGGDAASASRSEAGSRPKRDGGVGSSSKSDSGATRVPAGAMSVDRGKSTGVGIGRATRSSTRMVAKRAAEIEASLASSTSSSPIAPKPRLISHATTANGKPEGTSRVVQATAALRSAATRGHVPSSSVSSVPGNTRRPMAPPGSPQLPKYNTRSKLPLPSVGPLAPAGNGNLKVAQKRGYVLTPPPPLPMPVAEKGKKPEEDKEKEDEDPEWTHGEGANAVVVPGSKLERPNLRSVRRRRSSFSAADIVT